MDDYGEKLNISIASNCTADSDPEYLSLDNINSNSSTKNLDSAFTLARLDLILIVLTVLLMQKITVSHCSYSQ